MNSRSAALPARIVGQHQARRCWIPLASKLLPPETAGPQPCCCSSLAAWLSGACAMSPASSTHSKTLPRPFVELGLQVVCRQGAAANQIVCPGTAEAAAVGWTAIAPAWPKSRSLAIRCSVRRLGSLTCAASSCDCATARAGSPAPIPLLVTLLLSLRVLSPRLVRLQQAGQGVALLLGPILVLHLCPTQLCIQLAPSSIS